MPTNRLYLAVLPIVHLSNIPSTPPLHVTGTMFQPFGAITEQVLTLFPDRNFASEFYPDEVEFYINVFKANASQYLTGGHVGRYECTQQPTGDGRVVVMVEQHVG